jgi:hypothetical protein
LRERLLEDSLKQQGFAVISKNMEREYPLATAHLKTLGAMPEFSIHLGNYLSKVF